MERTTALISLILILQELRCWTLREEIREWRAIVSDFAQGFAEQSVTRVLRGRDRALALMGMNDARN